MKISYHWLQTYFDEKLPSAEKLAELFTFHAFEVEGVENVALSNDSQDTVIDVKILPDRANYCLSHKGVAQEVNALTGLKLKPHKLADIHVGDADVQSVDVRVDVQEFCSRYMALRVNSVKVSESPTWLKMRLEAIGSRSINSIVDITNYVMFGIGQPMHAFDADKIKGAIVVRAAKEGEKITTLDGKEVTLTSADHVIADDEGALAIAGVKGGKRAEVSSETQNVIFEAARFNAPTVRRTSTRVGIRNDSSKRFENAMSPEYAEEAMKTALALVKELHPQAVHAAVADVYPVAPTPKTIKIQLSDVHELLGLAIPEKDVEDIFSKLSIQFTKDDAGYTLTIPTARLDIATLPDVVEEIGRIYGYDKIIGTDVTPRAGSQVSIAPHQDFYTSEFIKNILAGTGFSEVYLYTLVAKGDIEVAYPLASDKSALRTSLIPSLLKSAETNARNAELLALDAIRIFEIGRVFKGDSEYLMLAIAAEQVKKGAKAADGTKITSESLVRQALAALDAQLGTTLASNTEVTVKGNQASCEIDIRAIVASLATPVTYDMLSFGPASKLQYQTFSLYPFMVRDIALFTSGSHDATQQVRVEEVIQTGIKQAGAQDIVARSGFFDVFSKKFEDGTTKTSYGYRIVLQSHSKTLSDEEANAVMEHIYTAVRAEGWEVR